MKIVTATLEDAAATGPVLASLKAVGQAPSAAVVCGSRFVHLRQMMPSAPATLTGLVQEWEVYGERIEALLADDETRTHIATTGVALGDVDVVPPVTGTQTYCAIGNYRGQLLQAALDAATDRDSEDQIRADVERGWHERRATGAPYVAITGSARITGPFDPAELAEDVTTLDWEIELAAASVDERGTCAWSRRWMWVAGYCVANDLTLRGSVFRTNVPALGTDRLACKGRSGWLPLGPWLVPASRAPNPDALGLQLRLNGVTMQAERTSDLLFSVAEVIAHLSHHRPFNPATSSAPVHRPASAHITGASCAQETCWRPAWKDWVASGPRLSARMRSSARVPVTSVTTLTHTISEAGGPLP
jgi:hypothetical protein